VRVSPMVLLEGGIICLMTGISMVFLVLLLVVK
jgi:Na+-transporting methylmalonyl-CoA/oxaloacetate decarboxylase gamma subunit